MRDVTQPPPAIKISVTQLQCTACGAETHASCNCGKPYMPKRQRAEEIAEANPNISVRELAERASVSHGTAQEAKARVQSRTPDAGPTVGRDGKQYPATKPQAEPDPDTPVVAEGKADRSLALQIIDHGCKAMTSRLQGSRDGMERLNRVRGAMRSQWDVEWF